MMDLECLDPEQTARCKRLAVHVLQELVISLAGLAEVGWESKERMARDREMLRREALRYVLAESEEPMGFAWLTETLDVDSSWLKSTLLTNIQYFIGQWQAAVNKEDVWIRNLRQA